MAGFQILESSVVLWCLNPSQVSCSCHIQQNFTLKEVNHQSWVTSCIIPAFLWPAFISACSSLFFIKLHSSAVRHLLCSLLQTWHQEKYNNIWIKKRRIVKQPGWYQFKYSISISESEILHYSTSKSAHVIVPTVFLIMLSRNPNIINAIHLHFNIAYLHYMLCCLHCTARYVLPALHCLCCKAILNLIFVTANSLCIL